jgi:hypothetical protein
VSFSERSGYKCLLSNISALRAAEAIDEALIAGR